MTWMDDPAGMECLPARMEGRPNMEATTPTMNPTPESSPNRAGKWSLFRSVKTSGRENLGAYLDRVFVFQWRAPTCFVVG